MLENFNFMESQEFSRSITEEEKELAGKAHEAGGESKLPREEAIRLIALRYMRRQKDHQPLSESDATELATIERDIHEAGGESKVAPEVFQRKLELRKKLERK